MEMFLLQFFLLQKQFVEARKCNFLYFHIWLQQKIMSQTGDLNISFSENYFSSGRGILFLLPIYLPILSTY